MLNNLLSMLRETPKALSLVSNSGYKKDDMTITGMLGYLSFICETN